MGRRGWAGGGFCERLGQSARACEGGAGAGRGGGRGGLRDRGSKQAGGRTEPQLHLRRLQSRAQPPRRFSVKLSETDALSWDFFFFFCFKSIYIEKATFKKQEEIGTDGVSASPPIPLLPRSSSHPETSKMNTEPAAGLPGELRRAQPGGSAGRPRTARSRRKATPGGRSRCRSQSSTWGSSWRRCALPSEPPPASGTKTPSARRWDLRLLPRPARPGAPASPGRPSVHPFLLSLFSGLPVSLPPPHLSVSFSLFPSLLFWFLSFLPFPLKSPLTKRTRAHCQKQRSPETANPR